MFQLLPPSGKSRGFLLFIPHWARGWGETMASEWVLVQTINFIFSHPQLGTISFQCLDSGTTEASPLGSPLSVPTQAKILGTCFTLLFPSPGRSQVLGNFFADHHALMSLVSCLSGVQELLNMFSGLVPVLLSLCFCGWKKGLGVSFSPFCWYHPLEVTHHNNLFLHQNYLYPSKNFQKWSRWCDSSNIFIMNMTICPVRKSHNRLS